MKKDEYKGVPHIPPYPHIQNHQVIAVIILTL